MVLGGLVLAERPARAADPSVGDCLLAAEGALKLRQEHKLRQTRAQLLVCSSSSCPTEVRQECMHRIDEVNAAAPTLVLTVKDRAGHELSAVKVSVDGQVLAERLDGSALPVDPGPHDFTFEASGGPPLTQSIILHEGEKGRRETVTLAIGTAPVTSTTSAAPSGTGPEGGAPAANDGVGSTQRTLGLVIGGIGVVGIGVGSVFGVMASSSWKSAQSECPDKTGCSPQAITDHNNAVSNATIATVGFIAGSVVLAGGLVLYFTAPKGDSARVGRLGLEVRPGGLAMIGEF